MASSRFPQNYFFTTTFESFKAYFSTFPQYAKDNQHIVTVADPEIWERICSHLPISTLKNLSLVSKLFQEFAHKAFPLWLANQYPSSWVSVCDKHNIRVVSLVRPKVSDLKLLNYYKHYTNPEAGKKELLDLLSNIPLRTLVRLDAWKSLLGGFTFLDGSPYPWGRTLQPSPNLSR